MKRFTLPVLLLLGTTGCSFDARVKNDGSITCVEAADCPTGFRCATEVGKCIAVDDPDRTAPKLDGPGSVSPTLARADDDLHFGFRVNEALAELPSVVLQFADGSFSSPIEVTAVAGDPLEFSATWKAVPTAPEGTVRALGDFLDLKGNRALRLDLGGSRLDFTAPTIIAGSESLTLTAGPSNPLPSVTALGVNSSATLGFTVSEALRGPPQLTAELVDGGPVSGLQFVYSLGASVTFTWTISAPDAGVTQGPMAVVATFDDLAGNHTRSRLVLPAPGLTLDTVPPETPRTDDAGVVLERTPWGSSEVDQAASFLKGAAGAAEPGVTVLVTEADLSREVGRVQATAMGTFTVQISNEITEVYVTAVDGAGNRSAARRVTAGMLVASMGGSVAGNGSGNPNEYESRDLHGPSFAQDDGVARFAASGIARPGGAALSTTGAWSWVRRTGDGVSPALTIPSVWDDEAARALALGGTRSGTAVTGALKSWAGTDWSVAAVNDPEGDGNPVASPGSGTARAAVYDPVRHETMLIVDAPAGTETWTFNGTSWIRRVKTASGPACAQCQLAFNTETGRPLLVDHPVQGGPVRLFSWDLASIRWEELDAGALVPSARTGAAVAWDPAHHQLVVFGGADDAGVRNDLWLWSNNAWTAPVFTAGPQAATSRAALWDSEQQRVVFAGGFAAGPDGGMSGVNDLWEWDGTAFSAAARTDAGVDLKLGAASLFFDRTRGQRVLIGGATEPGALPNESTYAWKTGIGWTLVSQPGGPSARSAPAAVWDATGQRVMIFGGRTGDTFLNASRDLWTYDGARWQLIDALLPGPVGPDARFKASLLQRPMSSDIVLFGGITTAGTCANDAWVLRNGKWAPQNSDFARAGHVAWFDPTRDAMLLAGGTATMTDAPGGTETPGLMLSSHRELRVDAGWQPSPLSGPFTGFGAAYASTAGSTQMVAHGGTTGAGLTSDTWSLTSAGWSRLSTSGPTVAHAAIAHDERVGAWVLFGGTTPAESATLWALDGGTWTRPPLADPEGDGAPGARSRAAFVRDSARNVDVLFGGLSSGSTLDDVWELHTNGRPSQIFRVKVASVGTPLPRVKSIEVRGIAGGSGVVGSTATAGVELLIWLNGAWRRLAPTVDAAGQVQSAPAATPASFVSRVEAADLVNALMQRADVSVAIVPRGVNGAVPASLVVDHVEARLTYELQ